MKVKNIPISTQWERILSGRGRATSVTFKRSRANGFVRTVQTLKCQN